MSEVQKLGETISELMCIFTRRRELEQWVKEGQGSEADYAELKAIEMRLQA